MRCVSVLLPKIRLLSQVPPKCRFVREPAHAASLAERQLSVGKGVVAHSWVQERRIAAIAAATWTPAIAAPLWRKSRSDSPCSSSQVTDYIG